MAMEVASSRPGQPAMQEEDQERGRGALGRRPLGLGEASISGTLHRCHHWPSFPHHCPASPAAPCRWENSGFPTGNHQLFDGCLCQLTNHTPTPQLKARPTGLYVPGNLHTTHIQHLYNHKYPSQYVCVM